MIEFMVIAAPRSATTWVSNWLTTDTTLCIHDPLFNTHFNDLDKIQSKKMLGVSCTGIYLFPDFVNKHPARKIILHRELNEINDSLIAIGIPPISESNHRSLDNIEGIHMDWREVFHNPKLIYEYLLRKDFDTERHRYLKEIEMQPNFSGLTINKEVTKRLFALLGE